ncbi:MAG: COX15/CtaA family protein [Cyclobacteriaceae bacterium]|nr:COX15/CtaA family protein [Cyclobacteriaceae bacterium]
MAYKNSLREEAIVRWLWAGILLVALMVAAGGITRLTGSGLSMLCGTISFTGEVNKSTTLSVQLPAQKPALDLD